MSVIKKMLKKFAPQSLIDTYWVLKSYKERVIAFTYDKRRFLKNTSKKALRRNNKPRIAARLVFHAHAIEKGLSHNEVRLGFGKTALKALARNIDAYTHKGFDKSDKAYLNSLSVLKAYIELHSKHNFDTSYLKKLFSEAFIAEALLDTSELGGVSVVNLTDKSSNKTANFKQLFTNRWSVREYADTPVDKSSIEEALGIAMKSPSICNRQSSRATVIYGREEIAAVLKLQGGITGYELPPALIMITTDTSQFIDVNERNQVWIDGGLFAMSVLMGLEYTSLAACPLNAMLSVKNDKKMRKVLNIPRSENIIMFISVGNFLEYNKVPRSFRYLNKDISRNI